VSPRKSSVIWLTAIRERFSPDHQLYSEIRSSGLAERSDRCHHGKEEKVLFPKLMQAGIPMNGCPLGVMLYEHDQARQLIREMEQALKDRHPTDFALCANRYAQLLEDHIAKEDNILFPKAEGRSHERKMTKRVLMRSKAK
jgi:hemerythrin-like domain-containing protein